MPACASACTRIFPWLALFCVVVVVLENTTRVRRWEKSVQPTNFLYLPPMLRSVHTQLNGTCTHWDRTGSRRRSVFVHEEEKARGRRREEECQVYSQWEESAITHPLQFCLLVHTFTKQQQHHTHPPPPPLANPKSTLSTLLISPVCIFSQGGSAFTPLRDARKWWAEASRGERGPKTDRDVWYLTSWMSFSLKIPLN